MQRHRIAIGGLIGLVIGLACGELAAQSSGALVSLRGFVGASTDAGLIFGLLAGHASSKGYSDLARRLSVLGLAAIAIICFMTMLVA